MDKEVAPCTSFDRNALLTQSTLILQILDIAEERRYLSIAFVEGVGAPRQIQVEYRC